MNSILWSAIACLLLVSSSDAQEAAAKPSAHPAVHAEARSTPAPAQPDRGEIEQLRQDLSRLKVLVNQMRSNLAFVQTSQDPLKHQFELEADAWQVIIEQMERRLNRMDDRGARTEPGR
jgi:hypothetical protein